MFFPPSTGIANTRVFGGFGVAVVDIIMTILAEFANKAPSFSLNSLTMTKLCNYHKYPWHFLIFTHVLCGLVCHFIPSLLLKRSFHFIMYLWICPWFRSSYVSFWALWIIVSISYFWSVANFRRLLFFTLEGHKGSLKIKCSA